MSLLHSCMGEGTSGVEAPPAASAPPHKPASGAVPPSASPDADGDDSRTQDPDNNAKNETGPAAGDQDHQPNQEAEAAGKAHGAGGTVAQAEEKPTPGAGASWPATPPGARTPPQRDVAPAPRTGDRNARAAETEPDVDAVKPGSGCTTPPPPPAHDSEASDDGRGSPLHEGKPGASVAAASRSRLLAFRSFSRDKKANKSDTAGHKEGKERRKRFWK